MLFKRKAQDGGYPDCVQCPEDEERQIYNFNVNAVIRLDKDSIRPNHAKRGLAKSVSKSHVV